MAAVSQDWLQNTRFYGGSTMNRLWQCRATLCCREFFGGEEGALHCYGGQKRGHVAHIVEGNVVAAFDDGCHFGHLTQESADGGEVGEKSHFVDQLRALAADAVAAHG